MHHSSPNITLSLEREVLQKLHEAFKEEHNNELRFEIKTGHETTLLLFVRMLKFASQLTR